VFFFRWNQYHITFLQGPVAFFSDDRNISIHQNGLMLEGVGMERRISRRHITPTRRTTATHPRTAMVGRMATEPATVTEPAMATELVTVTEPATVVGNDDRLPSYPEAVVGLFCPAVAFSIG
jgi:hypothetical protein